tara:strand:+ start:3692 stop:4879 length:1188 start_codon:yes stop_codon:yes gene_type:complete
MKNKEPLLSIIIPTKNRYPQLFELIHSFNNFSSLDNLEVLIQDNSFNNSFFHDNINIESYPFVKYFYDSVDKDAPTNFNDGINNSTGDYCIIIGDDDIINPYIIDIVKLAKDSCLDSLIYPRGQYYWPDTEFLKKYKYFEPSSLQFQISNKLIFDKKESKKELSNIISTGGVNLGNGPCLYHGLVRRKVLSDIYSKFGTYILGHSPDMSFTITLLLQQEYFYSTDVCLTVPGASFNSAAGMGRRGTHSSTLDNLPDIVPKTLLNDWDENLPRIWTGPTFTANAVYSVFNYYKIEKNVNYVALYTKILSDNFHDIKFVKKVNNYNNFPFLLKLKICFKGFVKFNLSKLINIFPSFILSLVVKLHPYYKSKEYFRNVTTIDECSIILKKYYKFINKI